MAKYHIKDNGEPGICKAAEGKCPLGSDNPHFETKQEAREHYEKQQEQGTFTSTRKDPNVLSKNDITILQEYAKELVKEKDALEDENDYRRDEMDQNIRMISYYSKNTDLTNEEVYVREKIKRMVSLAKNRKNIPDHGIKSGDFEYAVKKDNDIEVDVDPFGRKIYTKTAKNGKKIVFAEPVFGETDNSNDMYPETAGDMAESRLSAKEQNKRIREDFKNAVAVGYLPSNVKYSVRGTDNYKRVSLTGFKRNERREEFDPEFHSDQWRTHTHPEFLELERRVQRIADRYGVHSSNAQIDYFNSRDTAIVEWDEYKED